MKFQFTRFGFFQRTYTSMYYKKGAYSQKYLMACSTGLFLSLNKPFLQRWWESYSEGVKRRLGRSIAADSRKKSLSAVNEGYLTKYYRKSNGFFVCAVEASSEMDINLSRRSLPRSLEVGSDLTDKRRNVTWRLDGSNGRRNSHLNTWHYERIIQVLFRK